MVLINGTSENDILVGTAGPDTINGWEGDDTLQGGAGTDTLIGGFGNDQLDGGAGPDSLYGGVGNDTYYIDGVGDQAVELLADAAGGVDLVRSTVSHTLGYGIEHLALSGSVSINGTGNELNNTLYGNASYNHLLGLDGHDVLYGEGGGDALGGGSGNDVLHGQSGVDVLDGGTGADRMYGGEDNDLYIVDNVGDQTLEDSADLLGGLADRVITSLNHTLGYGIENLTLTGSTAINGTGNALHNILHGNSANNMLSGLDGNDLLAGFEGNDTLTGGRGNDVLRGGNGRDQLNGGAGNDRFDYDAVSESPTGTGRDVITGFAGAGTAFGDQIDLFTIDANVLVAGNQTFTWNGATPGGAGTLWYTGGVLYGNVDGDATPEFQIQLVGTPALSVGGTGTDILL